MTGVVIAPCPPETLLSQKEETEKPLQTPSPVPIKMEICGSAEASGVADKLTSIQDETETKQEKTGGLRSRPSAKISRAALRRLAHDAGSRFGSEDYASATASLEDFLDGLLKHCTTAMRFSKRR